MRLSQEEEELITEETPPWSMSDKYETQDETYWINQRELITAETQPWSTNDTDEAYWTKQRELWDNYAITQQKKSDEKCQIVSKEAQKGESEEDEAYWSQQNSADEDCEVAKEEIAPDRQTDRRFSRSCRASDEGKALDEEEKCSTTAKRSSKVFTKKNKCSTAAKRSSKLLDDEKTSSTDPKTLSGSSNVCDEETPSLMAQVWVLICEQEMLNNIAQLKKMDPEWSYEKDAAHKIQWKYPRLAMLKQSHVEKSPSPSRIPKLQSRVRKPKSPSPSRIPKLQSPVGKSKSPSRIRRLNACELFV